MIYSFEIQRSFCGKGSVTPCPHKPLITIGSGRCARCPHFGGVLAGNKVDCKKVKSTK